MEMGFCSERSIVGIKKKKRVKYSEGNEKKVKSRHHRYLYTPKVAL